MKDHNTPSLFDQPAVRGRMIDGFPLTDEQEAIVDAARRGSVRVQALAGTGKTTTLRAVVNDTPPGLRIHYLVFNSKMCRAAERTFDPGRVLIKTFHGLALAATRDWFPGRTVGNIRVTDLRAICGDISPAGDGMSRAETFAAVAATLRAFLHSADANPAWYHVPGLFRRRLEEDLTTLLLESGPPHLLGPDNTLSAAGERRVKEDVGRSLVYLAEKAQVAYDAYASRRPGVPLPLPHDVYLKAWQLAGAVIDTDLLLVDEAQDLNPVMLAIVHQHRGRIIAVGDSRQQIYGWRGSVDALDGLEGEELPLTVSFRFGPAIAARANEVLRLLGSPYFLEGRGPDDRPFNAQERHARLFRTNSAMLESVITESAQGKKVHCTRNIGPLVALLRDLCLAYNNQWHQVQDPRIQHARHWAALKEELEDDIDAAPLLRMVEQDSAAAARMVESLSGFSSKPAASADVILTTAHQSKGLEFTNVALSHDFAGRAKRSVEELRLLYVALTRAKRALSVPPLVANELRNLAAGLAA